MIPPDHEETSHEPLDFIIVSIEGNWPLPYSRNNANRPSDGPT
jgi:hypothetical protein